MKNLIKTILTMTLMLLLTTPSQAQFGKFLNKAKEKVKETVKEKTKEEVEHQADKAVKKTEAKVTGSPEAAAAAEAAEDLPEIYSIAKTSYAYGPDSPLEEVLYPELAFRLKKCLGHIKDGEVELASTTWNYNVVKIMGFVKKRDLNEERLKVWEDEFNRVEKIYTKLIRGDAPEPTGDKKTDAYNYMAYNIEKAKKASDRDKMKEFFTTAAMSREIYIKNDRISESDPKYKEIYDELVALRKKLEPYGYDNLIKVNTFAESKAEWKDTFEKEEAKQYNLFFEDNYTGADGDELKKLAANAVTKKYKATKIIHSNFKHGWFTNEERSGQRVTGHNKKCRVMIYFIADKKYYSCETSFVMQAPVGSNFTKTEWPGLTKPIEVPEEIFNREFKKFKK
ncbi:MAG: hypothetical protein GX372_02740 [Ignavibacteria bacterium]|jgi:hypothetical protein|nr:hypothetical protein [Ignavibacteria bacterium]